MSVLNHIHSGSIFLPGNDAGYLRWRNAKLEGYPTDPAALSVDLAAAPKLTATEHLALMATLQKTNMAIYRAGNSAVPDKNIARELAARFGLHHLDSNLLADDDGITAITVTANGDGQNYIPYTNRRIGWHCDGYYNSATQQIRGMVLHCASPAADGGDNWLLDHEIAYILLRDEDPRHIHALMQPDVMAIPPGLDSEGNHREAAIGSVFSIHRESGALHMRYTARKHNIKWKDDAAVAAALAALERILKGEGHPYLFHARLEAGMGVICNNVLHARDAFNDSPEGPQRLLYRARYYDRIMAT